MIPAPKATTKPTGEWRMRWLPSMSHAHDGIRARSRHPGAGRPVASASDVAGRRRSGSGRSGRRPGCRPVQGGRLRYLAGARLRWVGLLAAGAVGEFVGSRWGTGTVAPRRGVVGYLLLLGFALRNLALTGMILVACGLLANLAVIVVDGGMPVRGVPAGAAYGPRHHGVRPGDHLVELSDQIRWRRSTPRFRPATSSWPLGVATLTAGLMRPRRRPAPADV